MDANGTGSKNVARSLRKLGVKVSILQFEHSLLGI